MRGYILAIASLTFILVAFQNCSSFESDKESEPSSQCVNKLQAKVIQEGGWAESECTSAHHYVCSVRVFSPDVKNDMYEEEECFEFRGARHCMPLSIESFDTSRFLDRDDIVETAFDENGAYNRADYNCQHRFIVEKGYPMVFGLGNELKTAMEKAVEMCMHGVRK